MYKVPQLFAALYWQQHLRNFFHSYLLLQGTAKVGKVNVDEQGDLASQFGVMSIPTIMIFKNGKAVATSVGAKPKAELLALLD